MIKSVDCKIKILQKTSMDLNPKESNKKNANPPHIVMDNLKNLIRGGGGGDKAPKD